MIYGVEREVSAAYELLRGSSLDTTRFIAACLFGFYL